MSSAPAHQVLQDLVTGRSKDPLSLLHIPQKAAKPYLSSRQLLWACLRSRKGAPDALLWDSCALAPGPHHWSSSSTGIQCQPNVVSVSSQWWIKPGSKRSKHHSAIFHHRFCTWFLSSSYFVIKRNSKSLGGKEHDCDKSWSQTPWWRLGLLPTGCLSVGLSSGWLVNLSGSWFSPLWGRSNRAYARVLY